MSACRSCAAPILWATSEHGRKIPLDRDPYRSGAEERLMASVRTMLAEHRQELVDVGLLEQLEHAVAAYDASYDPRGLFVLRYEGGYAVAVATTPDAFRGEPVYRSHFATCSHPERHRRTR